MKKGMYLCSPRVLCKTRNSRSESVMDLIRDHLDHELIYDCRCVVFE